MAATVGSIQVLFTVNNAAYERGVRSAASATQTAGAGMERSVRSVDRATQQLSRTMGTIRGREFRVLALAALRANDSVERLRGSMVALSALFGGFGAAFTLKGIMDYSDAYKTIGNRLRTVKSEAQDLASIEEKIFSLAQRTRATYESTGVLFARISGASRRLAISQEDVLRVTETIQKAFVVGGSTQIEAAQSAIQLSQGIASNRLQGDELRSVLENPALGQLLAEKISGGDLGKLRKMAADGELTAKVIIKAFKEASGEIDRLFNNTEETIAQAFTKVDNALLKYIGTSGLVKTSTDGLITVLNAMALNMDTVGNSVFVLAGAFAGLMGSRAVGGFAGAMGAAISQTRAYNKDLRETARNAVTAAESELALSMQRTDQAKQAYIQMQNSVVSARTRKKISHELLAAYQAEKAAAVRLDTATTNVSDTVRKTGIAATAGALAMRGLGSAMAFVGGPVGVAFLALSTAMTVFAVRAQAAQERADRYASSIKNAGDESFVAAEKIRAAGEAMTKQFGGASEAFLTDKLMQAQADMASFTSQLTQMSNVATGGGFDLVRVQIANIGVAFKDGKISLQEFLDKTDLLARENPDRAGFIGTFQEIARQVEASRGAVDGFRASIRALKTESSTEGVTIAEKSTRDGMYIPRMGSSRGKFNSATMSSRFDDGESGLVKELNDQKKKILDAEKRENKPDDAERRRRQLLKEENQQLDKYIDGLQEMRNVRSEMVLDEFDGRVIETARGFGIAEENIRNYIDAIRSGGDIPAQFQAIGYEVEKLMALEDQIAIVDGISSAFGDMFSSVVLGSESASEALQGFLKQIANLILQVMVVEPLVQGLRSAMMGGMGIGGGGSSDPWVTLAGASLRAITAHKGWTVGSAATGSKMVHPSVFAGAQRFHSGLGNDEFAAILQEGERVLTKNQTSQAMGIVNAVAKNGGAGGGTVFNIDARGAQEGVADQIARAMREYDKQSYSRTVANVQQARKRRAI